MIRKWGEKAKSVNKRFLKYE